MRGKLYPKAAEEHAEYLALSPDALKNKVAELEKKMYEHAHNLEFEEAARLRDVLQKIQKDTL